MEDHTVTNISNIKKQDPRLFLFYVEQKQRQQPRITKKDIYQIKSLL